MAAFTKRYVLAAAQLSSVDVTGITDQRVDGGVDEFIAEADGLQTPEFAAAIFSRPMFGFTTWDLGVLDTTGVGGTKISNVKAIFNLLAEGGGRTDGSAINLSFAFALCVPRRLSARQGQPATLSVDCFAVSTDGDASPLTKGSGLAVADPDTSTAFTLGSVTGIEAVQEVDIDFGVREIVEGSDGDHYPTFCGVGFQQPSVTIRTFDVGEVIEELNGKAITATACLFRTLQVGDTATTGKTITINEGRYRVSADGDNTRGLAEIVITPTDDGTNDILAIS